MPLETNRREFNKTAALIGVGLLAGDAVDAPPALAQAEGAAAAPGGSGPPPLAPPDKQPPDLNVPKPVARKAGWAIVGLGELALGEILPAFGEAKLSRPAALVSGHPDKARQVAAVYGVQDRSIYDYDGFDRISDDDDVDIVYIVLPNSMHAEFTIRALKAGKHVLCEKPMAVSVEECERMIAAAREADRKLMIAYRLHYEPFNMKVMELCEARAYGAIKTFTSSNCQDVQAPNIRLSAALGGGPVGDVGVYSINAARYVTGEEPVEVAAVEHRPADDPRFREVPESVVFTLRFPSGVMAHCDCSFGSARSDSYRVHCAKGYVDMDPAFSYRGLKLSVFEGSAESGDARLSELKLQPENHFAAEMDHFSDCVLNGKAPRTPGEEGLADMRVVTAIGEAARSGAWVKVG